MNDGSAGSDFSNPASAQRTSAIFAGLVLNQSQMAAMLMGTFPHPESGERVRDLDAARMFIDQLEMLEIKTKGNLTGEEDRLLKQNLMQLRLMFVEAVKEPATPPPAPAAPEKEPEGEDGAGKRFTKKY